MPFVLLEGMAPALRDYQLEMKERLYKAWRTHRSVMMQMPTGTGKTHLLAVVVKEFLAHCPESGVWIVAHRRELVAQIEETVARYGMGQQAGAVRVMSVQWLARHGMDEDTKPGLIVIDEAHHALANTYRRLWKWYPEAKMLGMTATPCRMNREGFTELFEVLVASEGIAAFIAHKQLAVFDYVSIRSDSSEQRLIDDLKQRGADGDYQVKEMNQVLNRRPNIERLYRSVKQFADGKKGIVYAIGREHARRIAAYYNQQGMVAVAIDSGTPAGERRRAVGDYKEGKIQVLVNVDVFSEGFDCPDVEFVQMARPTLSLAKYLQQVGRGLRKAEGKETCMLIDNVGLYRRFGLPIEEWDWQAMFAGVAGRGKKKVPAEKRKIVERERQEEETCGGEMELIVSHEGLPEMMAAQRLDAGKAERKDMTLSAYRSRQSGLWGLLLGEKKITEAVFEAVCDIKYGMAAVRMTDKKCGLVNDGGEVIWEKCNCRSLKFMRDSFVRMESTHGKKISYVDLHNFQVYGQRPVVKKYAGIELLKVDGRYYSRTKDVYVSAWKMSSGCIGRKGAYLTIFDDRGPDGFDYAAKEAGYVCVLEGDEEAFYWVHRWLEDGSLVVMGKDGRYYHVEEGKAKRCLGSGTIGQEEIACQQKIAQLLECAHRKKEKEALAKEERRQQRLEHLKAVLPFCSGKKWGLKAGECITVPPIYRNVRPPVGKYCAVEQEYSQWGIITIDGRVRIEPRYAEVNIMEDGTAVLTYVTGHKISVKL